MKKSIKSSITLPASELKLVLDLRKRLQEKSNVAVIRRSLFLLKKNTDRETLRHGFALASATVREDYLRERDELERTSSNGLE